MEEAGYPIPRYPWIMATVLMQHIEKTPGICGGRACIASHRIRVLDIVVLHELRGYSADEIVAAFPGINLADVYAALAYYFDNREEIDADRRADDQAARELLSRHPSKVKAKLGG